MSYKENSSFLPIFLNVAGKKVLIIGAGKVAQRKIEVLLKYNLSIIVLAPQISKEIIELAEINNDKIQLIQDLYSDEYLEKGSYVLVFVTTDNIDLNNDICFKCDELGLLSNNVTSKDKCNFIMPAIIKEEDFQIAVSTSGKAPCVSKFIKTQLEETSVPDLISYIPLIEKIRILLKNNKNINEELKTKIYEKVLNSKSLLSSLKKDEGYLSKALNLLIEELK